MGAAAYYIPSGISSFNNYDDYSYAHSVLQSLLMHPLMKFESEFFSNLLKSNNMNSNRFRLTSELLNIYNKINKRQPADSSKIIGLYFAIANEKIESLGDNKFNINDPFYFLYYLLHFLHMELNFSRKNFDTNRLENLTLADKKQENMMQNIFFEFLNEYHNNSVIFRYFTNFEENLYNCPQCGNYYDFNLHNIFVMNLSKIDKNDNNNSNKCLINLDDCFNYYCNDFKIKCLFCNKYNLIQYKKIYNGTSLIIRFKRQKFTNKCDVDFPLHFDMSKYSFYSNSNFENTFYVLKSCISLTNEKKYCADINVSAETNSGKWIRYIDSKVIELDSSNDIKIYEPQILIYVLKSLEKKNNNNYNNNAGQNNNNNASNLIHFDQQDTGVIFLNNFKNNNFNNNFNNNNFTNNNSNNNINYNQNDNNNFYQNNFNNNNFTAQNYNNIIPNNQSMNANVYNSQNQNQNNFNSNSLFYQANNQGNNLIYNNNESQNFNSNSLMNNNQINNQFS